MTKKTVLSVLILLAVMAGCKPSRDKVASQVKGLENRLFAPGSITFNREKSDSLLRMYDSFIKEFPDDSLTPVYLFKSGNLLMNAGNGNGAIERFNLYLTRYPDKPSAPMCLFFSGFIYENMLRNLDKAKEVYLLFIEKYPNHEFAKDARLSIQNLGKTPEQMIKEFELMRRLDSIKKADSLKNLAKTSKKSHRNK
jgi:outer membrane protein assembly factor BamD (BamD/ComL family)